jgi:hypothetical protein
MGKMLVNALFAFKFKTGKSPSLVDFTNVIAQGLCEGNEEARGDGDAGRTRSQKLSVAVGPPSDRISHALVKGISLGLGGVRNQGSCRVCKDRHSTGVCVTCSKGLDSSDPEPFWLCSAGVPSANWELLILLMKVMFYLGYLFYL